jgi:trehalose 6-phosphate synthase/phosphatase
MTKEQPTPRRLVVVSNRLPFNVTEENGELRFKESAGGLVAGMVAALEGIRPSATGKTGYTWVGWPGSTVSDSLKEELKAKTRADFHSHPVFLTEQEMDRFYLGFCNKTIWPLFHYFPSYTVYQEDFWQQYKRVNEIFCGTLVEVVRPDDIVWIHDYHLMLLPQLLKAKLPSVPIGFFLHIPFPSFEIFRLLPGAWRREILEGFLGADLIGFHTYEYAQHFLQCVQRILGYEHNMGQIVTPDRVVKVETFPMGIDFEKFSVAVSSPEVQQEREGLKKSLANVKVVLSVDRQDYTKGILNRLQGFETFLESSPEFRGKVVLIMVVVPSRIGVEQYEQMKKQLEELVGKINGRFGSVDWTPVIYQYRQVPFYPLVALYSLADVALVTPLRDGMNLVAKEYIATRGNDPGVLILSEMAGAAKELGEAMIINPNNKEEIASALREALETPPEEQKRRAKLMQDRLQRYSVVRWANDFVQELAAMEQVQNKFCAKILSPSGKQKLAEQYKNATRRLLLLDYDGTLTAFVRHPQMAKPGEDLITVIAQLAGDSRNLIVLISGRDKDTLQQWFGGLPIGLVAEHGIWIKDLNEDWKMLKQQTNEWKASILPILQLYADRLPGASVEQKDYSLVWHYRGADPEQGQKLSGELMDHLVSYTANIDIQVMRGHKVIEVRTAGVSKGTAGQQFLSRETFDFILSIGDDWTDEDLFGVMPEWAYSIKVGVANTRARYNLRNPKEVLKLLDTLTRASLEVQGVPKRSAPTM